MAKSAKLSALDAGDCKELMTIQSLSVAKDSVGGDVDTWSDTSFVIAVKLDPMGGNESMFAGQLRQVISHVAYTPYINPSDLAFTSKHRLKYGSRLFQIVTIMDVEEQHVFFRLGLLEGVPTT